jgi:hypothetical protein
MYIAYHYVQGVSRYYLRESVLREDGFAKRELLDLGSDPEDFIEYPGGNSFYIQDEIVDQLNDLGIDPSLQELEDIFWPFVDPAIRHALRGFKDRGHTRRKITEPSDAECHFIRNRLHLIDKRRYNYLRLGFTDQSKLNRISEKLYLPLLYKSRDELEQWFMLRELDLAPKEYSTYVFSFLNLRRHFYEIFAGKMPQALDQEKLDRVFMEDICALNRDASFWGDEELTTFLQPYLRRYVIMYFDYSFAPSTYLEDIINEYISRKQFESFKRARKRVKVSDSYKEASEIFELSEEELRSMSKSELTRSYRKRAQQLHPDKGGKQEDFVRLTEVYEIMMHYKSS